MEGERRVKEEEKNEEHGTLCRERERESAIEYLQLRLFESTLSLDLRG